MEIYNNRQRLTQAQKNSNDFKWYKEQADLLDKFSFADNKIINFGVSEYSRKKVNYDLFNNRVNMKDFTYVCQPFGAEVGELPANFVNRDIVSPKIKVLLGMEMSMPFSWRVIAVNEEATTRREEEEFNQIRQFVVSETMRPIREQAAKQAAMQRKGRELTPDEEEQIQQEVNQQIQARTPDKIRKYMSREHQDPAEVLGHQLLEYLILETKAVDKFNRGFKHLNLSGDEIYWVGEMNGKPDFRVVNAIYFDHDKSDDLDAIEDGEWAVAEYRMTPSEIVANFGSQLKPHQIDRIYQYSQNNPGRISDTDFTFENSQNNSPYTLRVLHCNWKSLMKVGFLTYLDKNNKEQLDLVDENYRMSEENGDIKIEWEWIPQSHETYKILDDIYVYTRPVPGQNKDLETLYNAKLSYYGASHDNLNSATTAPMDRMKSYQYLFDIILYRIELLMASDKGKILAANIKAVPKSSGIDTAKFQYFMEANKIAWFNPNEEGNKGQGDVTNLVKEIDLSLASQINNYIQLAEYIERKCGESIGVPKHMEGNITPGEAVSNSRQNLTQASHIIKPLFELHNRVKANVLTALLEVAKVVYSQGPPKTLSYVLDDLSLKMLTIDQGLLASSTLGLYVTNSSKAHDAKQAIEQLSQAAIQNQQASLLDIIKIIRSDSIAEAEELLEVAQQKAAEREQEMERMKLEMEEKAKKREDKFQRDQWAHDEKMVVLKESERRKTEIQKQTILSLGFNEDKDLDDDDVPDILEVAEFGVDTGIKNRQQLLEENKFNHQKQVDKKKLELEDKKLKQQSKKVTQ